MPRLVIDTDRCIMAGECIYNHPDYFGWGEDDTVAEVLKPGVESAEDELHAEQAIGLCPGGAISIVDDIDKSPDVGT